MGYQRAGFEVIGVDINPQKNYPFDFIQADAMDYGYAHIHEFDAVHASPPCQRYSVATKSVKGLSDKHPDLVPWVRMMLELKGVPWVIENVVGAPMLGPIVLCGSMFGLLVKRHRLFETSFELEDPPPCCHWKFKGDYPCGRSNGSTRRGERSKVVHVYGQGCSRGHRDLWSKAMGIDWMTMKELAQAIPPAYTEWVGKRLMRSVKEIKKTKVLI